MGLTINALPHTFVLSDKLLDRGEWTRNDVCVADDQQINDVKTCPQNLLDLNISLLLFQSVGNI